TPPSSPHPNGLRWTVRNMKTGSFEGAGVGPLLASVPEACWMIGVKRSLLYVLIGKGAVTARKLGNKTLIDVASLQSFAASLPSAKISAPRSKAVA
ncbi:hypothetical protein, partial [Falsiroseomonas sp. E2-1-a20]|uniref:hypothetical protein n=1 Tax=Falsiroseomonas sp. E2-1-a20 TaxID=3239300 RepID=UPI003F2B2F39